jgi:indole-3-glycerol phosphate synthase
MAIPSILTKIVEDRRKDLESFKRDIDLDALIKSAYESKSRDSFNGAIKRRGLSIIGEVKKASPSKGIMKEDFDPVAIAIEYSDIVDVISVLTEERYFMGNPKYLKNIAERVNTPLLRKDFIIDKVQIYEAKSLGASAILLIASILTSREIEEFKELSDKLNMDCLIESHDKEEVIKSLDAGAEILGINNRDLNNFKINLNTTLDLRSLIPRDKLVVSESGINTAKDIRTLSEVNIDGVLVGESFMRSKDLKAKARELKDAYNG